MSLLKLKLELEENHNIKLSKQTISRIVKNKLGFSFRKTVLKNSKLMTDKSLIASFLFIKTFLRSLYLNIRPIFIDECKIYMKNSNFRTSRKKNQKLYDKGNSQRYNLIMAVDKQNVVLYELRDENTDGKNFKEFIKKLIEKIPDDQKHLTLLILDNLSSHRTSDNIEFYLSYDLKILFNVCYKSEYNCIELALRIAKLYMYQRSFAHVEES